ncbi:hypothetical protein RHMOL_Rhmol03G0296000 [Rhododendron molle]|uniref:Uncharacterized protein n=1 Tax=Rhododendron molle TaxID=49168 RepID=A0ACC0PM59_RHOML|nr:hypothetical protein RHMOL_Rhmol03G0296000 [Rhododendron molle]
MRDLRQVRHGLGLDAFMVTPEDAKKKNVEHILILSGDHLYRMDYMDFVQLLLEGCRHSSKDMG